MSIPSAINEFCFEEKCLKLIVPDYSIVEKDHTTGKNDLIPFWAKLWPSSIALCRYLSVHTELLHQKIVWELGAGLGLPSLYAAQFAKEVFCTDYNEEAVAISGSSARLNQLENITCRQFDWRYPAVEVSADCVLLSDINYDPADFDILLQLLTRLLNRGTLIILSTPQRLMAKPFIEQLLPFCIEKTTIPVKTGHETVEIFIMRLEKQG